MYAKAISYLLLSGKVTTEELFSFLEKQKLLTLLPLIMSEVKERKAEMEAKDTLLIESPFSLYESSVTMIKDLVGASEESKVTVREDKELLSGFRATYRNHSYDTSARTIINELIK